MLLIPLILIAGIVVGHTAAIMFLTKKRKNLDDTPEHKQQAKRLGIIIAVLYAEIPLLVALVWFVVAPALSAGS